MNHSTMQKQADYGVVCSGKRLCYDCRGERKLNKRMNNRKIRRITKQIIEEAKEVE